ncbi:MAG: cation transporter, partial [Acidobacteria bacterium]|nr:cation transporter [Acidobacteriota bacterium]
DVHHLHVWALDESERSFEGHVVIEQPDTRLAERVKRSVRHVLDRHGIGHATIECEYGAVSAGCRAGQVVAPH